MKMINSEIATILPTNAAAMLRAAAKTPIDRAGHTAREKAIDAAVKSIRQIYPQYFRGD